MNRKKCIISFLTSAFIAANAASVSAKTVFKGYKEDINNDLMVNSEDLSELFGSMFGKSQAENTDIDSDGRTDIRDVIILKSTLIGESEPEEIYEEIPDTYVKKAVDKLGAPLPSTGTVSLPVFIVSFPDCSFPSSLTKEKVSSTLFGPEDPGSADYPFESISAFYSRASKGQLNITGDIYEYTAKYPISYYGNDVYRTKITKECLSAFDSVIDYRKYDSDSNKSIDTALICVPPGTSDDDWWPAAGVIDDNFFRVDGLSVGQVIVGNEDLSKPNSCNSGYSHELGHCLGLPDYYLYYGDNSEGLRGDAGTELMDTDAHSDLSAVSKLALGWYTEENAMIYKHSSSPQEYVLYNAQTDRGNCLIIPSGTSWDPNSEYFVIEYQTETANNSDLKRIWWQKFDPGVRIYHASTEVANNGFWSYFKYENSYEENYGRRFIRMVNDGKPAFRSGSIIDSSTSGFGWYDPSGKETVNTGITVKIISSDSEKSIISIYG